MRGGPRTMCSPYLTGSLAVMLVLVTFNYWSVSTTNFDLVKEVQRLQTQLKTGTATIKDKDEDITELKEKLKDTKLSMQEQLNNLEGEKRKETEKLDKEIKKSRDLKQSCDRESDKYAKKVSEEKDELQKQVDDQDSQIEALKRQLSELKVQFENTQEDLEQSKKQLISLQSEQLSVPGHVRNKQGSTDKVLGPGQLPNVDPNAVSVIKKETQGSGLKLEPLPPGPSSIAPRGLSSSKKPALVDNIAGVMPPPNNLDQAEDDSHIPEHENGPEGKKDLQDDDQNPDGEIDESVDLDKQHFLEDKAVESAVGDTKDVAEGQQEGPDSLKDLQESLNTNKIET